MELTWYGHSCFLLKGNKTILIDPFAPEGNIPKTPDIIAVTHGHADHMGETVMLNRFSITVSPM